jgi:hypothetical protein
MVHAKILWKKWIFKYSLGELIGIGVAAAIARFLFLSYPQSEKISGTVLNVIILMIAGISEGLIIGYIQWRSLSKLVSDFPPLLWMFITTFATLAGWLFVLPPGIMLIAFLAKISLISTNNSILYTLLIGVIFGGMIGIPQFLIMRKYFENAIIWVLSNAVGWMMSFLIIYSSLLLFQYTRSFLIDLLLIVSACVLSGFIQGMITGYALHFLMSVKEVEDEFV